MKIRLDLNSTDLMKPNDPETAPVVMAQAHDTLSRIFEEKESLIKQNVTMKTNQIQIIYHDPDMPKLEFIEGKSDWIDLRASKDYTLYPGDFALIDLGVSMKLPDGYEAHLAPRSSTFKKWGIIQTNSVGVIDNSFAGNNDIWCMPVYATRITTIHKNDRIAQFRIVPKMPPVDIVEVDSLDSPDRGGFGSTGAN